MKTIITSLISASFLILGSTTASAQYCTIYKSHHGSHYIESYVYISGYRSNGTPIYVKRHRVGTDRHGHPRWKNTVIHNPVRYFRKHGQPVPHLDTRHSPGGQRSFRGHAPAPHRPTYCPPSGPHSRRR
ncbi:MAG: hypothetical protein ACQCXQ_12955 [Verrucomicrobiales bacterium]|nr:hypothetical protein [Verrucomicrobiota bacterium JB025]